MGIPGAPVLEQHQTYREKLTGILAGDLDFHGLDSSYASHDFHPFPAKFPPQLPLRFILGLTLPGDTVLDPMMGSGTTILEAFLTGRRGVGFDIDPLALMISKVKSTPLNTLLVAQAADIVINKATYVLKRNPSEINSLLRRRCDLKSLQFIEYWFAPETQLELMALWQEIEKIGDTTIRAFLQLAFSATIITKSGGVSLALDLAHTRPHRAKNIFDRNGDAIVCGENSKNFMTKTLRSPLEEFKKRIGQNLRSVVKIKLDRKSPIISFGNAQFLPLGSNSVDLIVTSPPYASNAIDYMRAHKFSLVWMGYGIDRLSQKRKDYIGGQMTVKSYFVELPSRTSQVVAAVAERDVTKGRVLHRYYSEMAKTLLEMFRVLKPGKAAIVVVGSSVMRGIDTQVADCLSEIGYGIGFEVAGVGVRKLDRNRRMMPAGFKLNLDSQIQQRMHQEYIIGFEKPETGADTEKTI